MAVIIENTKVRTFSLRLKPHEDLRKSLLSFAKDQGLKAAVILSGVGSLEAVNLRLANSQKTLSRKEKYEIVSMTGTLSAEALHVHLAVANSDGLVFGGHLQEGNLIYTTAELVILEQMEVEFHRELDPTYGYKELVIKRRE